MCQAHTHRAGDYPTRRIPNYEQNFPSIQEANTSIPQTSNQFPWIQPRSTKISRLTMEPSAQVSLTNSYELLGSGSDTDDDEPNQEEGLLVTHKKKAIIQKRRYPKISMIVTKIPSHRNYGPRHGYQ